MCSNKVSCSLLQILQLVIVLSVRNTTPLPHFHQRLVPLSHMIKQEEKEERGELLCMVTKRTEAHSRMSLWRNSPSAHGSIVQIVSIFWQSINHHQYLLSILSKCKINTLTPVLKQVKRSCLQFVSTLTETQTRWLSGQFSITEIDRMSAELDRTHHPFPNECDGIWYKYQSIGTEAGEERFML